MTNGYPSALIVAKPGPLRDSIQALMIAIPQIEAVRGTSDLSSALAMVFDRYPALVLLDSDLEGGEIRSAVRRVKAQWPQAQCVFLADDVQQQREGESAGADATLLKGLPATQLIAVIVGLLPQS
jgi:DNA-binding NarL/FixJ family response regulator